MDTTVILAQPRVPRLRAAVVYVDSWARYGAAVDRWFCSARLGTADPLVVAKSMFFAGVEPQSTAKRTETIRFLIVSAVLMTSKMRVRARSGPG